VTKSWNQSRPEPKGHGPELPFGAVGRTRGFYNIDKKQPFAGRLKTQAQKSAEGDFLVTRSNILFLIIGALVIVVAVMGYELYQDRKQPEGMRIDVGPNGLKIEKK
jgi:hypothetical protein